MKKPLFLILLFLIIATTALPAFGQSGKSKSFDNDDVKFDHTPTAPVATGESKIVRDSMPEVVFTDLENNQYSANSLRGKVVVIDYWASWCPPCRGGIPSMVKLKKKFSDKIVILGISYDRSNRELDSFLHSSELGRTINYPIIYDLRLPSYFGTINALPTTIFVDKSGVIRDRHIGLMEYFDYETIVEKLLSEK